MKTSKSIGKRYGKLVVIKIIGRNKNNVFIVKCLCDCGKYFKTCIQYIQCGDTKSCGCLAKESFKKIITKHGFAKTKFYKIYMSILERINNPKATKYLNYGGRGIKCLWKSFEEFHNDMYNDYLKHVEQFGERHTTIDRINFNGNYCKENCKWATMKEQGRNRGDNIFFTINGKTKCLSEWVEIYSLLYCTVYARLHYLHWTIEESLGLIPKKNKYRKPKYHTSQL